MLVEWCRTYVLSTWGFGYIHGLVGVSSSRGLPEICGQTSCPSGQAAGDTFLQLCFSAYFPFLSLPQSLWSLKREKMAPSAADHMAGQNPTCCLHAPPFLPERLPRCWTAVASLPLPSLCRLLCGPVHPLLGAEIDGLSCVWVSCAVALLVFFFITDVCLGVNQRRQKKKQVTHYDADLNISENWGLKSNKQLDWLLIKYSKLNICICPNIFHNFAKMTEKCVCK